ncbi:MAG: gliding motility-associated C-terminal domain-containing protein, partial [Bacteroidota bacterium]
TQSGTYVDSLISSIGCDSIVTTNLTVVDRLQTEPIYDVQSPTCFGGNDGSIVVSAVPDGVAPFTYMLDGVGTNANGIFTGLEAGTYQLEVFDRYNCNFPASILIPPPPQLSLVIPEDTSLSFGESLLLSSFTNVIDVNYSWTPAEGLNCTNCPDPIAAPPQSTRYVLRIEDDQGCSTSDSIFIEITKANFLVHTPTAFTPNGDGQNDLFQVIARSPAGIRQIRKFSIFNRWGQEIFRQEGSPAGQNIVSWDGSGKGKAAPQGVYVFVLELELIDDRVLQYSGSISLLR